MDLVGQQVGAYRVLSLLGRGGTAEVYKAYHPALKREVALKVMMREVSLDADWVRRFEQEAHLLGQLDHAHILPIYDAGEHEGRPFLVMKYLSDGTTLRTQLVGQPWSLNRVVKVVNQVADGLQSAHEAGVVHRDIKPSNILVTADLKCLVFDFGIAKPMRRDDTTTGAGLVVGTPEFMSPEQCKGDRLDHRSDIYSLGVLAYQMLTGHVPFTAETPVGILLKHLTEPLPIPPRGVALPPAVNGVLQKAMARKPEDRYKDAREFAEAFRNSADQRATVTLHASEIRRALPTLKLPRWIGGLRRRERRLGLATTLLLALMTAVYVLWPQAQLEPEGAVPHPPSELARLDPSEPSPDVRPVPPPDSTPEPRPDPKEEDGSHPSRSTPLSTLAIHSTETATVLLDGEPIGRAPGVFGAVEPGEHRVVLDAGQGRLHERRLVLTPGSTHHLRFDFSETPIDLTRLMANLPHQLAGGHNASTATRSPNLARRRELEETPTIRVWTGYLTDEDCGETGGRQGELHLRCAERCIREGKQPMIYSRGRLYRIDGLEKIHSFHGELRFSAWLELDTLHVVSDQSFISSR